MKLLVGLGNPGTKYTRNRHNVGFRVIDAIWERHNGTAWKKKFQGELAELVVDGEKCLLLKPQTYMNRSGNSVGAAMQFYKLKLADIIIFYDEIDLSPAKLRIKTGGGVAGHNGLRSISPQIGNDYVRVRIGVGRPQHKHDVANYVLHDFAKVDEVWLEPLIDCLSGALTKFLSGDYAGVMNEAALAAQATKGENGDRNKSPTNKQTKNKTAGKTAAKTIKPSDKSSDKSTDKSAGKAGAKSRTKSGGALADKLKNWLKGRED